MAELILHIGFHKTGTKFLQHKVFPNLPREHFLYNPSKITQLACDLIKAFEEDKDLVVKAIIQERKKLVEQHPNKKIVISREAMSGDLFSFYVDSETTVSRLSEAFEGSKIIYSIRYQVDWIVSCYRESLHEHHYQSIQSFLRFKNGENKFINNNYKDLDIHKFGSMLSDAFGKDKVYRLFYEDFRHDQQITLDKVAEILGVEKLDVTRDNDRITNRGYSAFSIKLSLIRYNLCKLLGLTRFLIHRPIIFAGKGSIPAGFQNLTVLPKDKYWHDGFLRDNEEVRSDNYPNLTRKERLRLKWSWRNIIKNNVDKLFYWDWDLLGEERKEMDKYFRSLNKAKLGSSAPKIYFD